MKIIVYAEPLLVKTSGAPGRGMLLELIRLRREDEFVLVFRNGSEQDPVRKELQLACSSFTNCSIHVEKISRRLSNLLALLRFPGYCKISIRGDVYLNMDCSSLGSVHPLAVTLADLSVMGAKKHSSFQYGWQTHLRKFILSSGIRKANRIIAISKGSMEQINHFFPAAIAKTRLVYNGIDNSWFQLPQTNTVQLPGRPYWIWWGMVSFRKNIDTLLKAYIRFCSESEQQKLPLLILITGTKKMPAEIEILLQHPAIGDKIRILPFMSISDLQCHVAASAGLVFPSREEGFGMPAVEAMAMGKPVLTSDIVVMKEITNNLGIYCNPESITSIAEGMHQLLSVETLSGKAAESRKKWASTFSYKNAALGYSNIIDEMNSTI